MKRVLVICTGNSARSQIAEALINRLKGDRWQAVSGGTKPSGVVHPLALQVLREAGFETTGLYSKAMTIWLGQPFDLVITVCDNAAKTCPFWLGMDKTIHHALPDPSLVEGDETTRLQAFRDTLALVKNEIFPLLEAEE
jgi:arsenate reductase